MSANKYLIPKPIVNKKEEESLTVLTENYEKLTKPGTLAKAGMKIAAVMPEPVKKLSKAAADSITEAELYAQCMKVVVKGFDVVEKEAAKLAIKETTIIKRVNETTKINEITCLEEICLVRGYKIS